MFVRDLFPISVRKIDNELFYSVLNKMKIQELSLVFVF